MATGMALSESDLEMLRSKAQSNVDELIAAGILRAESADEVGERYAEWVAAGATSEYATNTLNSAGSSAANRHLRNHRPGVASTVFATQVIVHSLLLPILDSLTLY